MGNFSDYIKNKTDDIKKEEIKQNINKENLENLVDKYSRYNSDQLMREFLKLTTEKKRKGELDNAELNNLKNTIMPYLDESQKSKLNSLIDMVDNV